MDSPHLAHTVLPGSGPYLFLLHGMLSSRGQWAANLEALAQVATPVVFELWGHGQSPTPPDADCYAVDGYLREFEWVRQALGVDSVLLCGQSFGAGLTLNYACRYPDRVRAQVFTNTLSGLSLAGELRSREQAELIARDLETHGLEALRRLPFHPARARSLPEPWKNRLVEAADHTDPQAVANTLRLTGPQQSALAQLDRIRCPTLLVNGQLERRFQPLRERAVQGIRQLRVVDLPAGHAVNLEQADAFNQAVQAFLGAHA